MKLLYLIVAFFATCYSFAPIQAQEMLLNGGFEDYSFSASCASEDYYICQSPGWKMLNNTPDVIHSGNSQNGSASHRPRTRNGNARFASIPNLQLLPYVETIAPQISVTPTSTNYVNGAYCFKFSQ